MMRIWTALRVMPAFLLAVPLWLFVVWYASIEPRFPADGYAVDAGAKATGTLAFIGPFCAMTAAWEGSRLRRGRLWQMPFVRSRVTVAAVSVLPSALVGTIAITVAIVVETARAAAGLPDMRFIGTSAADIIAFSIAGLVVGIVLPFAIAGPFAGVATFFWLAFTPAFEPVWLRHLTGMFRDCCGSNEDLALGPVLATLVVDIGIVAAAACIGSRLIPARRLVAASASFALTTAIGVILVAGMTYAPVVPRDAEQLTCVTRDGATVCLWPEHRAVQGDLVLVIAEVRSAWRDAGVEAPTVFTEAAPSVAPVGALAFHFRSDYSREDTVNALASALVPPDPECPGGSTGGIAVIDLTAWYSAAGGMSSEGLQSRFAGVGLLGYADPLSVVAELRASARETRLDWVSRATQLAQACDDWPPALIDVR